MILFGPRSLHPASPDKEWQQRSNWIGVNLWQSHVNVQDVDLASARSAEMCSDSCGFYVVTVRQYAIGIILYCD